MDTHLDFVITPQPDDTTCGPSCLHAVYRYYGDEVPVEQVVREVREVESGGTLAVYLGLHALSRGYQATIYTCDLHMFDPSWFGPQAPNLRERLLAQMAVKRSPRFRSMVRAYVEFLDRGGKVFMEEISSPFIARLLKKGSPIITGLCATWLYRGKRERPSDQEPDDIAGEPAGHFVVVHGVDLASRRVKVADPYLREPFPASHAYEVDKDRLVGAIMLGITTNDAKLLVIRPAKER